MADVPYYNTANTFTDSGTYDSTRVSYYDTVNTSTGIICTSNTTWYDDDGTGGSYARTYDPYEGYGMTNVVDHTYAISKEVTKKDLKAMKDEIRKYMQDQMVEDAREIAGQLFDDIEKLKEEKTQLKESVAELKIQVKQARSEIKDEVVAIEELLEKRVKQISKFANLDFSDA